MTKETFTPVETEQWHDGRVCHHSAAYMAMKRFLRNADALEDAMKAKRDADKAIAEARDEYKAAEDLLVAELVAFYGDDMPEAFEMPNGVLIFDEDNQPRYVKTRSYADTYRIEAAKKEAA